MGWLRKSSDPLSDHGRALNEKIARLESEIKKLDAQLQRNDAKPKLRSTALPHGPTVNRAGPELAESVTSANGQPIFEMVDQNRLKGTSDLPSTPEHYNELGVRKYDLPALFHRFRQQFRGPATTNPKLVSYLAAGGLQGLRPLRYEKRIARNRLIALVLILFLTLLGIILVFVNQR